jgi:CBS domain-containing protein
MPIPIDRKTSTFAHIGLSEKFPTLWLSLRRAERRMTVRGGAAMPKVQDILSHKGSDVASIDGDRTVIDAAQEMNRRRIGSLVVMKGSRVIGIFTERDILVRVVAERRDPEKTTVSAVMTAPVVCCTPETDLVECRAIVTGRRIRHIPIVVAGKLIGIVTSGDLMAHESMEREVALESLYEYIGGPGTTSSLAH